MKNQRKKLKSLLASVLVVVLSVITVVAYLFIDLGPLSNHFQPADSANPYVYQSGDEYSVEVPNMGYAVYVRAAIVVNWKYDDGIGDVKVLGDVPVPGVDYNLELNNTDWFKGTDGFYYHKVMVVPDGEGNPAYTQPLITNFVKLKSSIMFDDNDLDEVEDEYNLNIDIISQTIQAFGTTDIPGDPFAEGIPAVVDAWGIILTDRVITGPVATP